MPRQTTYAVQIFERRGERIFRGERLPATRAGETIKAAAAMVPVIPFAAALHLVSDEDGRLWTSTVIGSFGETPTDLAQSMLDG